MLGLQTRGLRLPVPVPTIGPLPLPRPPKVEVPLKELKSGAWLPVKRQPVVYPPRFGGSTSNDHTEDTLPPAPPAAFCLAADSTVFAPPQMVLGERDPKGRLEWLLANCPMEFRKEFIRLDALRVLGTRTAAETQAGMEALWRDLLRWHPRRGLSASPSV